MNVLECSLLRWLEYLKSCITGFVGLEFIMLSRGFRYISPTSWENELEWNDLCVCVYVCVNVASAVDLLNNHRDK